MTVKTEEPIKVISIRLAGALVRMLFAIASLVLLVAGYIAGFNYEQWDKGTFFLVAAMIGYLFSRKDC